MGHLKVWTNENARVEYFLEASLSVMVVVIFENNGSNYKKGVLWTGKGNLVVMSGRVHSLEWRRNREKFDVRHNEDCTLRTHLKFIIPLPGRRINGRSRPSSPRGVVLTSAWHEPTRAEEKKEEAISELKVQLPHLIKIYFPSLRIIFLLKVTCVTYAYVKRTNFTTKSCFEILNLQPAAKFSRELWGGEPRKLARRQVNLN